MSESKREVWVVHNDGKPATVRGVPMVRLTREEAKELLKYPRDTVARYVQSASTPEPAAAGRLSWAVDVLDAAMRQSAPLHFGSAFEVGVSGNGENWNCAINGEAFTRTGITHSLREALIRRAEALASAYPDRYPDRPAEVAAPSCTCHSCEVLPMLHEQIAQMCEYLGSKREDVPCDAWHLRDLIVKLRSKAEVAALPGEQWKNGAKATITGLHLRVGETVTLIEPSDETRGCWFVYLRNGGIGLYPKQDLKLLQLRKGTP